MRSYTAIICLGFAACLTACAEAPAQPGSAVATPASSVAVTVSDGFREAFPQLADEWANNGLQLGRGRSGTAVESYLTSDNDLPEAVPRGKLSNAGSPEAYWLGKRDGKLIVAAADPRGVLLGLSHLESDVAGTEGIYVPGHPVRVLHFVARNVSEKHARELIDRARRARMNTLIIQIADAVDLGIEGWPVKDNAWNIERYRRIIAYAEANGLNYIPELKLLTHQEKFFADAFPQLMFNQVTWDPRKPEVYDKVGLYLDRLIAETSPEIIHIGHDEVAGNDPKSHRKYLKRKEKPLPHNLFLDDVIKINEMLEERGVEVWMWGDMLLTPDEPEFAGMLPRHLHGWDDYATIRDKIPPSITIIDWHYFDEQADFPSLNAFRDNGHTVLGATWDRPDTTARFSRYAADNGAQGMMITLWSYVQRREWDKVDAIVVQAGEVFWSPE